MTQVRLVPFASEHLAGFRAMLADPAVLRYTRVPEPVPARFVESWAARYEAGRVDGTRQNFAIVDADDAFCGIAVAPTIDRDEQTAELGYVVSPHARGKGVAAEALRQLSDWAFEQGLVRLYLLISEQNPVSKKVAARAGYRFEGVMRSVYVKPGVREDTEVWARLSSDSSPDA
jgi:RimJ/RimL family protein N-acetyltransferase